jgi:hypothetical protein
MFERIAVIFPARPFTDKHLASYICLPLRDGVKAAAKFQRILDHPELNPVSVYPATGAGQPGAHLCATGKCGQSAHRPPGFLCVVALGKKGPLGPAAEALYARPRVSLPVDQQSEGVGQNRRARTRIVFGGRGGRAEVRGDQIDGVGRVVQSHGPSATLRLDHL